MVVNHFGAVALWLDEQLLHERPREFARLLQFGADQSDIVAGQLFTVLSNVRRDPFHGVGSARR
ncbi:hypothetical protein [Mycobacterium lacus]|uniref:hypothetical protein n=1 Tax=Mycobacterium lacus TaxID=169765 RepID=UPI00111C9256|nr:hypothetical protein [Mycobacterium lacus]MCV7125943.1 hypothetical protein [Mycobacterium lacus]